MRRTAEEVAIKHAELRAAIDAALPAQTLDVVAIHIAERRGCLTRVTVRRKVRERLEREGLSVAHA